MNLRRVLRAILVLAVLIVPLVLGYLLSLYLMPTPQIVVIRLEGEIWGEYTAYLGEALDSAARDRAVKAVVLDIVSPGGEVTASEGLYFDLLKLRESMPVIASVDEMAASGAYYIAAAADQIYAKPASMIGNVGVISYLPEPYPIDEAIMTTGPFKESGGPQRAYVRQMEMLKDTFVAAILAQRQERLKVGPEVISEGQIYLGLEAQRMGLIDAIGSQVEAVDAAAKMANLSHYEVVDRTPDLPEELFFFVLKRNATQTAATVSAPPDDLPPGFYYRYIEPAQ